MIYQKTQFSWKITLVFSIVILSVVFSYIYQFGNNPISTTGFVIIGGILMLTLLSLYKLTVIVKEHDIILKFGIGIFKIKIEPTKIIDIKIVNIPYYVGLGIRRTSKGMLYNVGGNKGVQIHYDNDKYITIGSKDPNALREVLIKTFEK